MIDRHTDTENSNDGSEYLLSWITRDAKYLQNWIGEYHELQVYIELLSAVLDYAPLTENLVKLMNPDFDRNSLVADLDEIGYPHKL